jgi:ferredoxin
MRVSVQRGKCAGHALCHAVSRELFPLDDEGYSALQDTLVRADDEDAVREAVQACPEEALTIDAD